MESILTPRKDILGDIAETTQELTRQLARLEELKQLVLVTEQEIERLKGKLTQYESAKALSARPINKCPPEILSIIFKYFILDHPSHVRRLLLVCRHWHNLIVQDPQMWSRIHIAIPEHEWNMKLWTKSMRPFISTCLERSRSAYLQVDLDFTNLQNPREQIKEKLYQGFWKSSNAAEFGDDDLLWEWLDELDYDDLLDDEDFIEKCVPEHVFGLMDFIVGPKGRNMERWQSLKMEFPTTSELASSLWYKLLHPTPNLPNIHFTQLDHLRDWGSNDSLPFFASTQCATVSDVGNWRMFSRMFSTLLRELTAEISSELGFFRGVAGFINLTKLCVRTPYGTRFDSDEDMGPCTIFLPVLQEFRLIGSFSSDLEKIDFRFPALKDFVLEWSPALVSKPWLPVVQPKRLRWTVDGRRSERIKEAAEGVLRDLLLRYTNTKELCVPASMKTVLLGLLEELSGAGTLPDSWEMISFHDTSDALEALQIRDVIGNRK